jgi:hypothetical protein
MAISLPASWVLALPTAAQHTADSSTVPTRANTLVRSMNAPTSNHGVESV